MSRKRVMDPAADTILPRSGFISRYDSAVDRVGNQKKTHRLHSSEPTFGGGRLQKELKGGYPSYTVFTK